MDRTVPEESRTTVRALVVSLLPTYPHVTRVEVARAGMSWVVTAVDGMGTAVIDRRLIEAVEKALDTAENH